MKRLKCVTTLLALSVLFSSQTHGIEITVGNNVWQQAPSGSYGEASDALIELNESDDSFSELYLQIEHPFPLLPSVKYRRFSFDDAASLTLDKTFIMGGEVYSVASTLMTDFSETQTDYTFYYEAFDNQLFGIDLGLTLRDLESSASAVKVGDEAQQSQNADSELLYMFYGAAQINLPLLNINLGSTLNYQDDATYDAEVYVSYLLPLIPLFDPYIRAGVKAHKSQTLFDSGLYVEQEWQSAYLGLGITF